MNEQRNSRVDRLEKSRHVADLPLQSKTALVTGASRGIGASVARRLARLGANVGINYRTKAPRAEQVAKEIAALGRESLLLQADITNYAEVQRMFETAHAAWGKIDVLVLNASGGLEKEKAADYAMILNRDAQVNLVRAALPLVPQGGCIVFVTSHLAHFYGSKPVYQDYEPVAASKKAGEEAIRRIVPEMSTLGIRLAVVSGDLIEGTITPKLLQRQSPGLIEQRRLEAGTLPDVEEFAAAIVESAIHGDWENGRTVYVGSTEWS